jgi:hypothetical protein
VIRKIPRTALMPFRDYRSRVYGSQLVSKSAS